MDSHGLKDSFKIISIDVQMKWEPIAEIILKNKQVDVHKKILMHPMESISLN